MTDLAKLIEAVEAGKIPSKFDPVFERALYHSGDDMVTRVYQAAQAYNGSVDAALALKAELLGDRWLNWHMSWAGRHTRAKLSRTALFHTQPRVSVLHKSPARALLLATLKAYQWEKEQ